LVLMERAFLNEVRNECRAVGSRMCGSGVRSNWQGWVGSAAADHQHAGGYGMHVCSQPWVTAKSRAASRDVKGLSKRNTRQ
jgi:hypothetical protein